jgi:hypothetical protein
MRQNSIQGLTIALPYLSRERSDGTWPRARIRSVIARIERVCYKEWDDGSQAVSLGGPGFGSLAGVCLRRIERPPPSGGECLQGRRYCNRRNIGGIGDGPQCRQKSVAVVRANAVDTIRYFTVGRDSGGAPATGTRLTQSPPYSWRVPLAVVSRFRWHPCGHWFSVPDQARDLEMFASCASVLAVPRKHLQCSAADCLQRQLLRYGVRLCPLPHSVCHFVPQWRAWHISDLRAMGTVPWPDDSVAVPCEEGPQQDASSHRPRRHHHRVRDGLRGGLVSHGTRHRKRHCCGTRRGGAVTVAYFGLLLSRFPPWRASPSRVHATTCELAAAVRPTRGRNCHSLDVRRARFRGGRLCRIGAGEAGKKVAHEATGSKRFLGSVSLCASVSPTRRSRVFGVVRE